jgi:hypothetical protein
MINRSHHALVHVELASHRKNILPTVALSVAAFLSSVRIAQEWNLTEVIGNLCRNITHVTRFSIRRLNQLFGVEPVCHWQNVWILDRVEGSTHSREMVAYRALRFDRP